MLLFAILSIAGIKIDITDLPGRRHNYLNSYFIVKATSANKHKILGNQLFKENYVKKWVSNSGDAQVKSMGTE